MGEVALGSIMDVYENYGVQVNNRHPWTIAYRFQASGREYDSKTTTLRPVGFTHHRASPCTCPTWRATPRRTRSIRTVM